MGAVMVTNPPYGERITTDDILDLYATIGSRLKQQFAGNDAWIISSHDECFAKIGFRPSTKIALFNGSLPCELHRYQVFSGKLSDRREEGLQLKSDEELRRNAHFKPLKPREESDFDGHSWRGKGSRDDEHYFRSRPDQRPGEWSRQRKSRRDERHGQTGREQERERRRPFFEGDEDFLLNRRNFKWGDRGSDYVPEDGNLDFHNPLKKNKKRPEHAEHADRREGFKPRRDEFKPRRDDFKPRRDNFKPRREGGFKDKRNFRRKDS